MKTTESVSGRRRRATLKTKPMMSDMEHMMMAGKSRGLEVDSASMDRDMDGMPTIRMSFRKGKKGKK